MNNVFFYITIAVLCFTVNRLLEKYILRDIDPYAYTFFSQTIGAIIFAPFAIAKFDFPVGNSSALLVLVLAGLLWSFVSFSRLVSIKKTEISLSSLNQSRVIWVFLLGTLFLGEPATLNKFLGTLIIFFGISLLLWHPEHKFGSITDPGVLWTLLSAFMYAVVSLVDKTALRWFSSEVYIFLVYLIPAIVLAVFLPKRIAGVWYLMRTRFKVAVFTMLLSVIGYYFSIRAFAVADITLVFPLLQLSTLLTVIGGMVLLKEREHITQKIIATIIAIAGAIILRR